MLADPYAPERPLLIDVFTFSKNEVFGPQIGEVVAKDVPPSEPVDARHFGRSMSWRLVQSSVHEARLHARERRRG
jgi:hypothetical protein